MCLFTKMMKKNKSVVFEVKKQHTIVPRSQLPNIILKMFRNILSETGSVIREKLYVLSNLFVLNSGIFTC